MKKLFKAAALVATFTAGSANAQVSTFDFSYIFNSTDAIGEVVTGSLVGELNGLYITNISDVQVFLNGAQFLGPLTVAGWDPAALAWDNTPVLSTDKSLNNFIFADSNVPTDFSPSNYFWFTNDATNGQDVLAVNTNVNLNNTAEDSQVVGGTWTIAAVPLPTSLPLMISGLGLLAAAGRRRLQG